MDSLLLVFHYLFVIQPAPWPLESTFSSVTQLCPTLCDPVDGSMPGFPVHHQLLEPSHPRHPLLPPSIFPSIRVFSNESVLHIRWLKDWSLSFSISPSNECSGLTSFRMDWFDLLVVQETLKSILQHHSSKASIHYSAIKKNTFESVLMRWMKLELIIQSEVSQKEKQQYSILTHIYGI